MYFFGYRDIFVDLIKPQGDHFHCLIDSSENQAIVQGSVVGASWASSWRQAGCPTET